MNHGADIRLVDAHAKRDGGDDHLQATGAEQSLHPLALLRRHPGVIGGGWIIRPQLQRQQFGFLAGRRVDDGGPPAWIGQYPPDRRMPVGHRRFHRLDRQIGAAEAVDVARRLRHVELAHDVVLHQHGGGRGQRDDRRRPQQGRCRPNIR